MQAPAKPAALYIQPRLTTIDTTIRGGPSHIDDLRGLRRFSAQFVIAACFARGVQPEARADEQILAGATGFES